MVGAELTSWRLNASGQAMPSQGASEQLTWLMADVRWRFPKMEVSAPSARRTDAVANQEGRVGHRRNKVEVPDTRQDLQVGRGRSASIDHPRRRAAAASVLRHRLATDHSERAIQPLFGRGRQARQRQIRQRTCSRTARSPGKGFMRDAPQAGRPKRPNVRCPRARQPSSLACAASGSRSDQRPAAAPAPSRLLHRTGARGWIAIRRTGMAAAMLPCGEPRAASCRAVSFRREVMTAPNGTRWGLSPFRRWPTSRWPKG